MTQTTLPQRLETSRLALQWGLGLAAFLAGLDKLTNLLADWPGYLAPIVAAALPVSPETFMHVVGVIEMAVGLAILTRWTREAAIVAMAWLLLIAGNLVMTGRFFDVAVRDVLMAIGAYTLSQLATVHEAAVTHHLERAA